MNQIVRSATSMRDYSPSQLDLIRRTVAKDTSKEEFDMFIEICRRQQLDPFRRQIYAFVFNKDKPDKRQFVTVTGIDGYRAIARRTGQYRPSDSEPEIEIDPAKIDPDSNPAGIVKAIVIVYQFGPDKKWYPVVGSARWEEFAPIEAAEYDWVETGETWDNGKPKKKRVPKGDKKKLAKDNWKTMPHTMIAKCAEAQALRKGWPEELGGLYIAEEMMRAEVDMTATEAADKFLEDERLKLVGGNNSIPLVFNFMSGIEMVPMGIIADKIIEHVKSLETGTEIELWMEGNRAGLQMYWARNKSEALEVKSKMEAAIKQKPRFVEKEIK